MKRSIPLALFLEDSHVTNLSRSLGLSDRFDIILVQTSTLLPDYRNESAVNG